MHWNLRMRAAERGIWKSVEFRRLLADAGLDVSAGKMSMLWTTTPTTIRLEDLDVICTVLDCTPSDLLTVDPQAVADRRPDTLKASTGNTPPAAGPASSKVPPRLGRHRSLPPA